MWQQRQHSAVRAKLEIRILGRISTAVDDAVISTCSQVKVESDTVLAVLKDRHEWELRDLQTKLEDALRAFSVLGPYDLSGCRGGVSQYVFLAPIHFSSAPFTFDLFQAWCL